jgi:GxxExxY protein
MNKSNRPATCEPIPLTVEQAATKVVDAAYRVHEKLGPGLLEQVYETCLAHELTKQGLNIRRQIELPVIYDGLQIDAGYRIDILVNDCLVLELKAVENILPLHKAQLMTYLKLANCRLGLLINFNVPLIKVGIKRVVL